MSQLERYRMEPLFFGFVPASTTGGPLLQLGPDALRLELDASRDHPDGAR